MMTSMMTSKEKGHYYRDKFLRQLQRNPEITLKKFYSLSTEQYQTPDGTDIEIYKIASDYLFLDCTKDMTDYHQSYYISSPDELYVEYQYRSFPNSLSHCSDITKEQRYVGLDSFTHSLVIGYLLFDISEKYQIPTLQEYYLGVLCSPMWNSQYDQIEQNKNGVGISYVEYLPKFNLYDFVETSNQRYLYDHEIVEVTSPNGMISIMSLPKEEILLEILSQIVFTLELLGKNNYFSFGGLLAQDIHIIRKPVHFNGISSNITVKFANYQNVSISVDLGSSKIPHRFYNSDRNADILLQSSNVEAILPIIGYQQEKYYVLGELFTVSNYQLLQLVGVPIFSSLDLYTMMISLLCHPIYFLAFFARPQLITIFWQPLWFPGDDTIVYTRLLNIYLENQEKGELPKSLSLEQILTVLRHVRLKCHPPVVSLISLL